MYFHCIDGLSNPIPIISVEPNTFESAEHLHGIRSYLSADNRFKVSTALRLFEDSVDVCELDEKLVKIKTIGMTPKMFEYNLIKKAQQSRKHIVLPEGDDERVLMAVEDLIERDVADLTLLGDPEVILPKAQSLGIDMSKIKIIKPCEDERREKYAEKLVELRKHKGLSFDAALDLMCDVSYFGTMMIHCGDADGMVSGAAHTTQHTIRPALQIIKTVPDASIVSSVFFMCLEDRVVIYGDCAVNPNPNAEQLAEIAIQSAKTSIAFGIEPRVAMLSYSSGSSGKGEEVEKVRKATEIVKEKWPDLLIEGPIQYDAAVDKGVGLKKMPDSKVAGQATVLIFPDLNTGNNTYKAVQRETKALAVGPLLQGLNKPVNDLSRGCLVADIVNTVAMTAVQSEMGKE